MLKIEKSVSPPLPRFGIKWATMTAFFIIVVISLCFVSVYGYMYSSYLHGDSIVDGMIGDWKCIQFYKDQKVHEITPGESVKVKITENQVFITGSERANIFAGADRSGSYRMDGESAFYLDMGNAVWYVTGNITASGYLRLSISDMKLVLYLQREE